MFHDDLRDAVEHIIAVAKAHNAGPELPSFSSPRVPTSWRCMVKSPRRPYAFNGSRSSANSARRTNMRQFWVILLLVLAAVGVVAYAAKEWRDQCPAASGRRRRSHENMAGSQNLASSSYHDRHLSDSAADFRPLHQKQATKIMAFFTENMPLLPGMAGF